MGDTAAEEATFAQSAPAPTEGPLTLDELQLAARNHGMPLEALQFEITPTGLHYLLIHFDIPAIDVEVWRLRFGGNVRTPLELSLGEIQTFPRVTLPVTMECAGNGRARLQPRPISQPWLNEAVGTAMWTGTPLHELISMAGLEPGSVELVFAGADHGIEKGHEQDYARSLRLEEALRPEVILAYEMNGRPLEPQHGFPLRLIVPGWYGMTNVKWLKAIDAVTEPFSGYQQSIAYHYRSTQDDLGVPVSRMRPRALMCPPGFPDFLTRQRIVDRGPCKIIGRAWAGTETVARVEFGVNGEWRVAELGLSPGRFAWRQWSVDWDAVPGDHLLSCRAGDEAGNVQPVTQHWNWQGMGNNQVQSLIVHVR